MTTVRFLKILIAQRLLRFRIRVRIGAVKGNVLENLHGL